MLTMLLFLEIGVVNFTDLFRLPGAYMSLGDDQFDAFRKTASIMGRYDSVAGELPVQLAWCVLRVLYAAADRLDTSNGVTIRELDVARLWVNEGTVGFFEKRGGWAINIYRFVSGSVVDRAKVRAEDHLRGQDCRRCARSIQRKQEDAMKDTPLWQLVVAANDVESWQRLLDAILDQTGLKVLSTVLRRLDFHDRICTPQPVVPDGQRTFQDEFQWFPLSTSACFYVDQYHSSYNCPDEQTHWPPLKAHTIIGIYGMDDDNQPTLLRFRKTSDFVKGDPDIDNLVEETHAFLDRRPDLKDLWQMEKKEQ